MVNSEQMAALIIDALLSAKIIIKADFERAEKIAEEEIRTRLELGGIYNEEENFPHDPCPPVIEINKHIDSEFDDIPEHYFDCLVCLKLMMTEKLKLCVEDRMTFDRFMKWFTSATWLIRDEKVSRFKLRWAEYTNGDRTLEDFKQLVRKEILEI